MLTFYPLRQHRGPGRSRFEVIALVRRETGGGFRIPRPRMLLARVLLARMLLARMLLPWMLPSTEVRQRACATQRTNPMTNVI
jgi:hypothetical protein